MKKLLSLILTAVLAFSFTACEKNDEVQNEVTEKPEELITTLSADENVAVQYYNATKETIPAYMTESAYSYGATEAIEQDDLECFMADVTGDNADDLIVMAGALYHVYTLQKGYVTPIYEGFNGIMASGTSLVEYNGKYCTKCESASSSTGFAVSLVQHIDGEMVEFASSRTVFSENYETTEGYEVNGKLVSEEIYNDFNENLGETVELYSAEKLKENALEIIPKPNDKIDYDKAYKGFVTKYEEQIGKKSGKITSVDIGALSPDGYMAEEGFVTHAIKDFNDDGVKDLITVQEVTSLAPRMDGSESSLYVKAYTVADEKIVLVDTYEVYSLLPMFSFVDITIKDKTLMVSGIGAWMGDPSFDEHYMITLRGTKFDVTFIDSMMTYSWGGESSDEEMQDIKKFTKMLNSYGFRYDEGACSGYYNKDAKRLALYSLDGTDGRCVEYFEGTVKEPAGFYNYNK